MKHKLRILLADDHEMIRRGLRALLLARRDWTVCGEAVDGREAVDLAGKLKPDIAILDITMPLLGGLEATRRILKCVPHCEVLILTMHESEQLMREILLAGARGYVRKADAGQLVASAVDSLSRHQPFFPSEFSSLLHESHLKDQCGGPLTERESEVAKLIAEGRSSKEIAADLGLSPHTVETHRLNLMRKLNVHSLSEIVRYAIRNGMIQA